MRALRVIASSISPSISHETFFSARRAVKTRFACSVAQRGRFIYLSDSAVERALAALADVGELLEIRRLSRKLRTRMRAPPQGRMCLPLCGRVGVVVDAAAEDLSGSKANSKSFMYFGNFLDARTSARMPPRHHPRPEKLEEV